jgi:hypothetical protein
MNRVLSHQYSITSFVVVPLAVFSQTANLAQFSHNLVLREFTRRLPIS